MDFDYTYIYSVLLESPKKEELDEIIYIKWGEVPIDITGGERYHSPMERSDALYFQIKLNHQLHNILQYLTVFDMSYIDKRGKERYKTAMLNYLDAHEDDSILINEFDSLDQTYAIVAASADGDYQGHAYLCFPSGDKSICLLYGYRDRVDTVFLKKRPFPLENILEAAIAIAREEGANKIAYVSLAGAMIEESVPTILNKEVFSKTGSQYIRHLNINEPLELNVYHL
jgi:hypothetical protein